MNKSNPAVKSGKKALTEKEKQARALREANATRNPAKPVRQNSKAANKKAPHQDEAVTETTTEADATRGVETAPEAHSNSTTAESAAAPQEPVAAAGTETGAEVEPETAEGTSPEQVQPALEAEVLTTEAGTAVDVQDSTVDAASTVEALPDDPAAQPTADMPQTIQFADTLLEPVGAPGSGESFSMEAAPTDAPMEEAVGQTSAPDVAVAGTATDETDAKAKKRREREAHRSAVAANRQRAKEERERRRAEKEATQAVKQENRNLGPRYEAAKKRVGEIRKLLLDALNRKALLLNAERVGEAVPLKNTHPELAQIEADIKRVKAELAALQQRKRDFVARTPELEAACAEVRRLQRERNEARKEKRGAYAEAMAARDTTEAEQPNGNVNAAAHP